MSTVVVVMSACSVVLDEADTGIKIKKWIAQFNDVTVFHDFGC